MQLFALNGTWIDIGIILFITFFLYEGWHKGLWVVVGQLLALVGSIFLALVGYKALANIFSSSFSLANPLANAVAFLLLSLGSQTVLNYIFGKLISKLPAKYSDNSVIKYLALGPSLVEGGVMVGFFLTLALILPVPSYIKQAVNQAKIGAFLMRQTAVLEKKTNEIFGGIIENSLTYLAIEPGNKETVPLNVQNTGLSEDEEAETGMFALVNKERKKEGVQELRWDPKIVPVARKYARDMWERKYFSHYSPEGKDVGDRLTEGTISFAFAGENLALAPTLETAHDGLMNSPGHKANILDSRFNKVGIGVIDNGIYGKLFVQVFTD